MWSGLSDRFGPSSRERRLVLSLCATTILLWLGASALLPLLPAYLRRHGAGAGLVGIVMAAYYAASVVTQYPAGRLADRIGRRQVLVGGLACFSAGSVGFAATTGPGYAIVFRALQGGGAGAVTVASAAMIGAELSEGRRGGAFGALYGSQTLALAIGPLAGSIAGTARMGPLFLVASVLALVAATPVLASGRSSSRLPSTSETSSASALPSPSDRRARAPSGDTVTAPPRRGDSGLTPEATRARPWSLGAGPAEAMSPVHPLGRTRVQLGPAVLGAVLVFAASGVLIGAYETTWTLLLELRGASNTEIGLSWTLFALPFAALSVPAGRLAERVDRRLLVVGSLVVSGGFAAVYPFVHGPALLVGLGTLEAAGSVAAAPAAVLVLSEAVPASAQGAAQGAVETARTAAAALAAAAAGALFGLAPALPFEAAAGLVGLACVGVLIVWRHGAAMPASRRRGGARLLAPDQRPGGEPSTR